MKALFKDIENQFGTEAAKLSEEVTSVVRAKVMAKNLFGWKTFIDDMLVDLVGYMIKTKFVYSGGAYVACGMQSAIDCCRYCSAKKRRGDYESLSLDEFFQVEDTVEEKSPEKQSQDLVIDISIRFGDEFAEKLRPYLCGYETKLDKDVLAKCKTPEFLSWYKEYLSK